MGRELTIQEYKKEEIAFFKKHSEYCDELVAINLGENKAVDQMPYETFHDKWEAYNKQFPEKVKEAENARNVLKEKYGCYSSIYMADFYCIVHNVKELNELYKNRYKGKTSNYKSWLKHLKELKGKMIQSRYEAGHYGKFIGLVFYLDDVYFAFKHPKTDEVFWDLSYAEYNKWDHRDWKIVENGKDYI